MNSTFSFEFFPPKDQAGLEQLYETVAYLSPLKPSYVSVTYGAGGSTRRQTVDLTSHIQNKIGIAAMAHLTCVGHSYEDLHSVLGQLKDSGVSKVLALRGDPPKNQDKFIAHENGPSSSEELVTYIRKHFDFHISAACYPEGHIEAPSKGHDLYFLKRKVDAGVDVLVTQLFFDNQVYHQFVAAARWIGIEVPVVPGIMPVTNLAQLEKFTKMCGASIPAELKNRLEPYRDDRAAIVEIGIDWATQQCQDLLESGAPGIHFYTLNRSHSTRIVCERLRAKGYSKP